MPFWPVSLGKTRAGRQTILPRGGGSPFTPPAPPPVGGYTDWYESREINLSPPYNPDDAGDVAEWFSLFGSNSLATGGTPGTYAISGLNGLPAVDLGTRELDGNESFTGGSLSFVFVASGGIIRLSSSGDNFEVAAGPGNFTINFQGSPILTGPAVDSQFHVHCITYDSVLFILRWWMDGALVGVAGSLTALALLNGPLSFNDTFIFAFVGYDFALSPTQVNSSCRWYGGTGTGAPATGISVATYVVDPAYVPGLAGWWEARFVSPQSAGTFGTLPGQAGTPDATASGVQQPTLVLNDINGESVFQLNGLTNSLFHGVSVLGAATMVILGQRTADSALLSIPLECTPPSNVLYGAFVFQQPAAGANWGGITSTFASSGQSCLNQYRLMSMRLDGAGGVIFNTDAGGNVSATLTPFSGDSSNRLYIGSDSGTSAFAEGKIAMVLLYQGSLSDADWAFIKQYSTSNYAVP